MPMVTCYFQEATMIHQVLISLFTGSGSVIQVLILRSGLVFRRSILALPTILRPLMWFDRMDYRDPFSLQMVFMVPSADIISRGT